MNLANLSELQITKNNVAPQPSEPNRFVDHKYIRKLGATPNETKSLKPFEIKEFSFLYIVLHKPELFKENFHLIENVKLFSNENKLLFSKILNQSNNLDKTDFDSFDIDQNLINRVIKYASIKHIIAKNPQDNEKILEIFTEITRDLKNYELEFRITEIESKFSKDLSEDTFNELKELKKQQKIN